jgi:hypothetical protein
MNCCKHCQIYNDHAANYCMKCGKLLEEVPGPERHLVGQSRSDGRLGDVEEAKLGRRAVGETVERAELLRYVDAQFDEAQAEMRKFEGLRLNYTANYYEGRSGALADLRQWLDRTAEERSGLSNEKCDGTARDGTKDHG